MNLNSISTQLMYTTIPIVGKTKTGATTGTAFIFTFNDSENRSIPFLVTNAHVVKDIEQGYIEMAEASNDIPVPSKRIRIDFPGQIWSDIYKENDLDIVAIPIGPLLNNLAAEGKQVFFRGVTDDLIPTSKEIDDFTALEELVFIGYPAGIMDQKNFTPIIRRGITATPLWIDFEGRSEFLIDAGVFPGSSGSPVFILNEGAYSTPTGLNIGSRIKFIGVLRGTMRNPSEGVNHYIDLGVAIKAQRVHQYLKRLKSKLMSNT